MKSRVWYWCLGTFLASRVGPERVVHARTVSDFDDAEKIFEPAVECERVALEIEEEVTGRRRG